VLDSLETAGLDGPYFYESEADWRDESTYGLGL
jgi:hypothetical protein